MLRAIGGVRLVKAEAFLWCVVFYMTRLLPIQGVVLSISFPRVSLRSALGYVLNGLSGRSSSAVRHFLIDPRCGFARCGVLQTLAVGRI